MKHIYFIFDGESIIYVGSTINTSRRLYQHRYRFGDHVTMEVVDVILSDVQFWECYWIQLVCSWGFKLKNRNLGYHKKIKQRNKSNHSMSEIITNKWKDTVYREKVTQAIRKFTSDEKWKKQASIRNSGENNPCWKKVWTTEERKKLSDYWKGRPKTQEFKDKVSKKMGTPVMVDGVRYNSFKDVKRKLGLHVSTVKRRLNSSDWPNWQYVNSDEIGEVHQLPEIHPS